MNLADASSIATRTYIAKLRELLPFYFLMLGVPALGATVASLSLPIIGYVLSRAGVLIELREILQQNAPIELDSQPSNNSPLQQQSSTPFDGEAIRQALTDVGPAFGGIVLLFAGAAVLLTLFAFAAVGAGRLHSVYGAFTGGSPVREGTTGVFSETGTLVALYVLEVVLHLLVPALLGSGLVILGAAPLSVSALLILLGLVGAPVLHIFCAFTRSAAVVDGTGPFAAAGSASSFVRSQFVLVLGYSVVAVVAVVGLSVLSLLFSALQAPRIMTLIFAFAFFPFFDIFRTLLYAQAGSDARVTTAATNSTDSVSGSSPTGSAPWGATAGQEPNRDTGNETKTPHRSSRDELAGTRFSDSSSGPSGQHSRDIQDESPSVFGPEETISSTDNNKIVVPARPLASKLTRLGGSIRTGWDELVSFTGGNIGLVLLSTGLFVLAVAAGWLGTEPIGGLFEASIERRVADIFPPGTALNFFGNNWAVGIRQATAGFAFGVPTLVSLVQNGVLIGALLRFEVAPVVLVAFLIPHGLIELPALWLSGALGLHLGRVGTAVAFGQFDHETLADEIDFATDVLIGLGVLFAIAAVIEGFISPYYWQLFL